MKLFAWGANNAGQLGLGFSSEQVSAPTEVKLVKNNENCLNLLLNQDVSKIYLSSGGSHTHILLITESDYKFYNFGKLANKIELPPILTLPIPENIAQNRENVQLVSGWDFSLFSNHNGQLYSLGLNSYGELGRRSDSSKNHYLEWESINIPSVEKISAGLRHACTILNSSQIATWGDGSKGQLKISNSAPFSTSKEPFREEPLLVPNFNFNLCACAKDSTLLIGSDGILGGGGVSKFGLLDKIGQKLCSDEIIQLECGWNHALALLANGSLISWGRNNLGQLGRKVPNGQDFDPEARIVDNLEEEIVSISCGSEHNLALGASGYVYAWGWNEHINCGLENGGEIIQRPTKVHNLSNVIKIGTGGGNSFAITC